MDNLLHYTERINPPEPDTYECPVCGEELTSGYELFFNEQGECVGCECCITKKFVEDYFEAQDYYQEV